MSVTAENAVSLRITTYKVGTAINRDKEQGSNWNYKEIQTKRESRKEERTVAMSSPLPATDPDESEKGDLGSDNEDI